MQKVAAKILAVMEEVDRLTKDGRNKAQSYDYVSESGAIETIRPAMVKHKLIAIPNVKTFEVIGAGKTSGGADKFLTTILTEYTFIDVDSGESLLVSQVGQGIDAGDKGAYKASTGVNKYILMKAFQMATGDDPEKDRADEKTDSPQSSAPSSPSAPTDRPKGMATEKQGKFLYVLAKKKLIPADKFVEVEKIVGMANKGQLSIGDAKGWIDYLQALTDKEPE